MICFQGGAQWRWLVGCLVSVASGAWWWWWWAPIAPSVGAWREAVGNQECCIKTPQWPLGLSQCLSVWLSRHGTASLRRDNTAPTVTSKNKHTLAGVLTPVQAKAPSHPHAQPPHPLVMYTSHRGIRPLLWLAYRALQELLPVTKAHAMHPANAPCDVQQNIERACSDGNRPRRKEEIAASGSSTAQRAGSRNGQRQDIRSRRGPAV